MFLDIFAIRPPAINVTEMSSLLQFSGRDDQQSYANLLSEVKFENTADEPGAVSRQVLFSIVDDKGRLVTATATVQIIPTNDRAIITFAGDQQRRLVYLEGSRQPIHLFNENDTITDSDGDMLSWLSITLTPGVDVNDVLDAEEGNTGLTVTVTPSDNGEVLLNISGDATFAAYEAVLETVTFSNTFPGIAAADRVIQVVTFDGETESAEHTITVNITQFNDLPMCYFGQVVSARV